METLLSILIALSALVLVVNVTLTESKQAGLGTLSGEETVWGQNKGSSKQDLQTKITIVSSIVFIVALLVLAAI